MMFGNAVFSFIMTQFLDILASWKEVDEDIGDGEQLPLFYNIMKRMNEDQELNYYFKDDIERYFEYRWRKNKNAALESPEERNNIAQLPIQVMDHFYCGFLFESFLR